MCWACHDHIWPGAANLSARERETQALDRALTAWNAAMARTAPSRGLDSCPASASHAPIPTENSIGRS
jgi:hypothetical protein